MMRLLLPLLLLLIGVGGGVGAGLVLGSGSPPEDVADAAEEGAVDPDAEDEEAADAPDPPRVEQTGNNTEYVRLNNQFVVPVVRNGAVRSLVVLGLAVEVDTGQSSIVFTQELRLRDSFLRVLFAHANVGGFDGNFTEAAALAPLREGLVEAASQILGAPITHDVLVTDITRQDA